MPLVNKKGRILYTQQDLIDSISSKTGFVRYSLNEVFDALAESIVTMLKETTSEHPVEVKITNGIVITGNYEEAKEAIDPRDGSKIIACPRIDVNAKISRTMEEYVNGRGFKNQNTKVETE